MSDLHDPAGRQPRPRHPLLLALAVVAGVGVCLTLWVALFGSEAQLLGCLKDDGFYYLAIARNIAAGHGPTFDGLGPTNGFHPLWGFMLAPIFLFKAASPFTAVRVMIVAALLLHLLAALAVRRAATRLGGPGVGPTAGWLYAGNPLALYLVVSGMESPLAALIVALTADVSIRLRQGDLSLHRSRDAVCTGLLCGLCMLVRTELILLAGLVIAADLVPWPRAATGFTDRVRGAVVAGLTALAVTAPWLIWNLWRFGSVVQVSAQAHHLHSLSLRTTAKASGLQAVSEMSRRLVEIHQAALTDRIPVPAAVVTVGEGLVVALVIWWLATQLRPSAHRRDTLTRWSWLSAPILYALGFLAAAFLILGHFRSWYAAGPLTVAAIALSLPLHAAGRGAGRVASGLVAAGYALVMFALGPVFLSEIRYEAGKTNCWFEAATVVADATGPDERVSAFNAGTFGYLAPRTVVNLDCVVNNRALPYLAEKKLPEFMVENDIRYLIDDPKYVRKYFRVYSPLGWDAYVSVRDTLASGLVFYEINPVSGRRAY